MTRIAYDQPTRARTCGHCKQGVCHHRVDGPDYVITDWCCDCGGCFEWMTPILPAGAASRVGAALVAILDLPVPVRDEPAEVSGEVG